MIQPFPGKCMWRKGIREGWILKSVFWGPGQLCPCRLLAHPTYSCFSLECPQKLLWHLSLLHISPRTLSSFFTAGGHTYMCCHYSWAEIPGGVKAKGFSSPPPPVPCPICWTLATNIVSYSLPGDVQQPILLGWHPCHSVLKPGICALKI